MENMTQEKLEIFDNAMREYFLVLAHVQQSENISKNEKFDLFVHARGIAAQIKNVVDNYNAELNELNSAEKMEVLKISLSRINESIQQEINKYDKKIVMHSGSYSEDHIKNSIIKFRDPILRLTKEEIEQMCEYKIPFKGLIVPENSPTVLKPTINNKNKKFNFDQWCADADKWIADKWENFKTGLLGKKQKETKTVTANTDEQKKNAPLQEEKEPLLVAKNKKPIKSGEKKRHKVFRILNYIVIAILLINELLKAYGIATGIKNEQIITILMLSELINIILGSKKSRLSFILLFMLTAAFIPELTALTLNKPNIFYFIFAMLAILFNTINVDGISIILFVIVGIITFIDMFRQSFDWQAIIEFFKNI
ncbi:MAG: hypothetical protein LBM77_11800 [Spirochaetaceae bacterium]|jgi:hypothetical protein|nr:hypothetical protein [Spirochaetaceae bacterium]